jgi:hypothetical protein
MACEWSVRNTHLGLPKNTRSRTPGTRCGVLCQGRAIAIRSAAGRSETRWLHRRSGMDCWRSSVSLALGAQLLARTQDGGITYVTRRAPRMSNHISSNAASLGPCAALRVENKRGRRGSTVPVHPSSDSASCIHSTAAANRPDHTCGLSNSVSFTCMSVRLNARPALRRGYGIAS